MQRSPITARTYTSVAFDQISFSTLKILLLDAYNTAKKNEPGSEDGSKRPRATRWKWRFIYYSLLIGYILLFPTLVAAMTGYQALFKPYVHLPNRVAPAEISELRIPSFVVRDGSRIGLHDDYTIFKDD